MKVKLFTHTDLDGIGCAIIAKLAFGKNVDIEYCDYNNVNEKIANYIISKDYKNHGITFITDISINEQVAEMIDEIHLIKEFVLIDHHKTALWLNKYEWSWVSEYHDEGIKSSGTTLFYQNISYYKNVLFVDDFVESVRRYDTWEWKNKYNDIIPKQINDLMYILGRDIFIEDVVYQLENNLEYNVSQQNMELLNRKQKEIDDYIDSKDKTIIVKEIQGYQAGVIFAERFHSELGNKLAEKHPELDFIAIVNPSQSISYRTVKNIDLSVIANIYKGGGHPKASGSPVSKEMQENIINILF
jgi:oligoribonuclease NrnB/cAMP/cGMP phosphodiesterase (DHH superfamily)